MVKHRFIMITAVFAMLISCLFACSDENGAPRVELQPFENIADYTVVRGDNSSNGETAEMLRLIKAIDEAVGVKLVPNTDWLKKDAPIPELEILVGKTNREQSKKAADGLRAGDYRIAMIDGKLVIVGGSDKALSEAMEHVISELIDKDKKLFYLPENGDYTMKKNYPLDKLTIDGTDIGEFCLLADSEANKAALERLNDTLIEKVGVRLHFAAAKKSGQHYITVDRTLLVANEYRVAVENGSVVLRGSYSSADKAVEHFINKLMPSSDNRELHITTADSVTLHSEKKPIYTKDQLMTLLDKVYDDPNACIIGEQTDGGKAMPSKTIEKFTAATGEAPGILGLDLACYGLQLPTLDAEKWSQAICEVTDYCANGGIVTISSHFANPSGNYGLKDLVRGNLGYDDTLEGYEKAFRDLVTEGTEYNRIFKEELDIDAGFLKALGDNGVTVLWRPLHESNGNWFWYCTTQNKLTVDPSCLKELWIYIYKYYTEELGIDNLIWVYSPNVSSNNADKKGGTMSTLYCYPGDEYVDMVGCDWYTGGTLELKSGGYKELVERTKMSGAITEFGPTGKILGNSAEEQNRLYNGKNLLNDLLSLKKAGFRFAYLLTWESKWTLARMGNGTEFMQSDYTLGQADLARMFDELKISPID